MDCCVSVILPRLPDGVSIQRTLNSIRRQTLKDIEILSAIPIDEGIAAEYENLTVCNGIDESLERAGGTYVYFMHPESVLAFSALKRLADSIEGNSYAVCKSVVRYDGKNFEEKSGVITYAGLFNKEYIQRIATAKKFCGTDIEFLADTILSDVDNRVFLNEILVYIDVFCTTTKILSLETAAEKVREYTNSARNLMQCDKGNANFVLFVNYIMKFFVYFEELRREGEVDKICPLFEALHDFLRIADRQPGLVSFIKRVISPIDTELFLLSKEAFAAMIPLRGSLYSVPISLGTGIDYGALMKQLDDTKKCVAVQEKALMENHTALIEFGRVMNHEMQTLAEAIHALQIRSASQTIEITGDAVSEFANRRAGFKTLAKCFFMWLKIKFRGETRNG